MCAILSLATMVRVYRTGEWVDIGGSKFHARSEDAASIRHLKTIPAGSTFWVYPFLTGLYPVVQGVPFGRFLQLDPFLPGGEWRTPQRATPALYCPGIIRL